MKIISAFDIDFLLLKDSCDLHILHSTAEKVLVEDTGL